MGIEKTSRRPQLTPDKVLQAPDGSISLAERYFVLSSAAIAAMNATPVNVIPAPPANQALLIDVILFQMKPGSAQFTGGGAVTFQYSGTALNPHAGDIPASTVNSSSPSQNELAPATAVIQVPPGVGLDITNAGGAFASGNGTAVVKVYYKLCMQG